MDLLLRGIVVGFAIAAPVGPIGVLCIRRTLSDGRISGLVSGLGAATADAVYGVIAALGLTFVSELLAGGQLWMRLAGGAFLVFLGCKTFLSRPSGQARGGRRGLLGAYASTFLLTIANPATILSFAAIFAGLGAVSAGGGASAMLLVVGVFGGSALWWSVLSGVVGAVRGKLTTAGLRWINRISGAILLAFGLFSFLGLAGLGS